eukprot:jgi/Astpho2/2101/Aster-x1042
MAAPLQLNVAPITVHSSCRQSPYVQDRYTAHVATWDNEAQLYAYAAHNSIVVVDTAAGVVRAIWTGHTHRKADTGHSIKTPKKPPTEPTALTVSSDGTMAIWADRAGHLWTWDLFLEGSVAQKVAGLELQAAVTCLHADPSGSHQVAVGTADGCAILVDLHQGRELQRLGQQSGPVQGLAWVPLSGPAGTAHASAQLHARTAEATEAAPLLVAGKPQALSKAAAGAGGCQQQADGPSKLPAAPGPAAALAASIDGADSGSQHAPQQPAAPMTGSGTGNVGSAGQECSGSTGHAAQRKTFWSALAWVQDPAVCCDGAVLLSSTYSGQVLAWRVPLQAGFPVPAPLRLHPGHARSIFSLHAAVQQQEGFKTPAGPHTLTAHPAAAGLPQGAGHIAGMPAALELPASAGGAVTEPAAPQQSARDAGADPAVAGAALLASSLRLITTSQDRQMLCLEVPLPLDGRAAKAAQVTARIQGLGGHASALDVQPSKDHMLAIGCGDGTIRLVQWLPHDQACLPRRQQLQKQPVVLPGSNSNGTPAKQVPQAGTDVQPKRLSSQLPAGSATKSEAELLICTGAAPEGTGIKPGSAAEPQALALPLKPRNTAPAGNRNEAGSATEAEAELPLLTTTATALAGAGTSASLNGPGKLPEPPGPCLEPAEAPSIGHGLRGPTSTSFSHQTPVTAESSAAHTQLPQLEWWQRHADRLLRWHPTRAALLAFGCSDGSVGLLDAARQLIRLAPTQHPAGVTHLCWGTGRSGSSMGGTVISSGNGAVPGRGLGTSGAPSTAAASAAAELCSDAGAALTPSSRKDTSDAYSAAAPGSADAGLGGSTRAANLEQCVGSGAGLRAAENGTSAAGTTADGHSKQAGAFVQKDWAATSAGMAGTAQKLDMLVSLSEDGCLLQWAALPAVLAAKQQVPASSAGNKGSAAASRHFGKAAGTGTSSPLVGAVVLHPGEHAGAVATAGQTVKHTPSSGVIQLCAPTAVAAATPPGPAGSGLPAVSWRAPEQPDSSTVTWEVRHVLPAHQQAVQSVTWQPAPSTGARQLSALLPPPVDCCSLWSGLDQPEEQLPVPNAVPAPALLSAAAGCSIGIHRETVAAQGVLPAEAGWQSAVHELRSPASALAVHPGSPSVLAISQLRAIQVLRLTQGACQILCTLTGHAGRVCSLAFHPAGAILLSGSEDQSIRAWDLPYEMQQAERERTRLLLKQQQQDVAVVRPQELQQQQQEESTATPHELQQAVREPSSPLSKNQQEEPSARHQQLEGKARQQQQSEQHLGAGLTQQHPAGSDGKSQRQQAPEATGSHQGEPSASLLEEPGGPAMGAGSRPEHTETSSSALPGRDAATAADRPWNAAAALACRLTDSATSEPEAAAQPLGGQAAAVEGRSTPFLGETNAARATAQMPGSHLEIASPAGAIAADTQQPHCTTAGTQAASPSLTLEEGPATSRVPRQPASPSRAAEPQERADLPPLPAHGPQTLLAPIGLPFDTDANSGPQAPVQGRDSAAEGSHAAARAARPPVAGGKAQKKAAARYLPSLGAQQIVTADGVRAQDHYEACMAYAHQVYVGNSSATASRESAAATQPAGSPLQAAALLDTLRQRLTAGGASLVAAGGKAAAQQSAAVSLWAGDVGAAIETLLDADALSGDFVSMAAGMGPEVYAATLEVQGEVHLAALHLLSTGDVHGAMQTYARAHLLGEAVALGSARLLPQDPFLQDLHRLQAAEQEQGSRFAEAAGSYLAGDRPLDAVNMLVRQNDAAGLRAAADLAATVASSSHRDAEK